MLFSGGTARSSALHTRKAGGVCGVTRVSSDHASTDSSGGTELTDQTIGLSASYAITEWFSVGAQINYTWTPSHTLRHEGYMGDGKHQLLWGGINATISF